MNGRGLLLVLLSSALLAAGGRSAAQAPPSADLRSASPAGTADSSRPAVSFEAASEGFELRSMRLDGLDVTAFVAREGAVYRYEPLADLAGGEHVVSVEYAESGAGRTAEWTFSTPLPPQTPEKAAGWSFQGEGARTVQEPVEPGGERTYRTPLSGTPHVEGSISVPDGSRRFAFNATLAQPYESSSPPTHVSVPAAVLGAKVGRVEASLGNGPVEAFAPSLLLQTVTTRRGLEVGLDTGIGSLRVYGNVDDGLPSANGVNQYRQNLYGASFAPDLGSQRLRARVVYQHAADARDPLWDRPPQAGPAEGDGGAPVSGDEPPPLPAAPMREADLVALVTEWTVAPSIGLVLKGEAAASAFTPDAEAVGQETDWAWAVSAGASPLGFSLLAGVRSVGSGFGSPANPALVAGRTITDVNVSRPFGALSLSATYAHTADSGSSTPAGPSLPEGKADTGAFTAAYTLMRSATSFSASLQLNESAAGESRSRQRNVSFNVAQPVGKWQLSLGLLGGKQEAEGFFASETTTSGATLGLSTMGEVFSLQASGGVNRSRSSLTGEVTTSWNLFAQPDVSILARRVSLTPIGVYACTRTTAGFADTDSYSYGGRLTVRTWGALRGLAFFGQALESVVDPRAEGAVRTKDRRFAAGLVVLVGGGALGPAITTQLPQVQTSLQ